MRIYGNPMARLQQISARPWHSTIVRVVGLSSACRKSSANGFSLVSNALLPLLYLLILTGLAAASIEGDYWMPLDRQGRVVSSFHRIP